MFQSCKTYIFQCNAFWWNSFHVSMWKKKTKRLKFQISHFYWLFWKDIMAAKGLKTQSRAVCVLCHDEYADWKTCHKLFFYQPEWIFMLFWLKLKSSHWPLYIYICYSGWNQNTLRLLKSAVLRYETVKRCCAEVLESYMLYNFVAVERELGSFRLVYAVTFSHLHTFLLYPLC